jgi:hypothetical protein
MRHCLLYSIFTDSVKEKAAKKPLFGGLGYKVFPTPDRCFLGS